MVNFVFAGKPDCANYAQVINAALYLKRNLPSFDYTKHAVPPDEWDEYLVLINREHKWHHTASPLIYKELYNYGVKRPTLIGGMADFWEYCYDYYGMEFLMTQEEIGELRRQNIKQAAKLASEKVSREMKVMIYGAMNKMSTLLLPELMKVEGCGLRSMRIVLYDEHLATDNLLYFDEFCEEIKDMFGSKPTYVDNLGKELIDCELVIMIDDTSGLEMTGDTEAMKNYLLQIFYLAEEINLCGNRGMKIIFANSGLSCLVATILARKIRIPQSQVVVVSSDLGLGYLGEMSRKLGITTAKMCAPPVWGSLGLNEFVDTGSTLVKCKVYKPYARAVRATKDSTLTHGTIHCELRFINYLSDDLKDLKETVRNRRNIVNEKLQRAPMFAKLEAVLNLIKIWFGCSNLKDPIISLGIMSDGSFNIPEKIMFSQPAIQFHGGWIPYSNYPVPDHILKEVIVAGEEAENHYSKYSADDIFRQATRMHQSRSRIFSFGGSFSIPH